MDSDLIEQRERGKEVAKILGLETLFLPYSTLEWLGSKVIKIGEGDNYLIIMVAKTEEVEYE